MKQQFILCTIFLMFVIKGYAQQKNTLKISSLDWLLGKWQMEKNSGLLTESWQQSNDSTFEGISYLQKASGEKKLLEKVQIVNFVKITSIIYPQFQIKMTSNL